MSHNPTPFKRCDRFHPCPCCGQEATRIGHTVGTDWNLLRCSHCHHCFTWPNPDPTTISDFYRGFRFENSNEDEQEFLRAKVFLEYHFKVFHKKPRFLDFGGGCGLFAAAAADLGWDSSLFDIDDQAVQICQERYPSVKATSSIDTLPCGSFDAILCYHVIEHMADPKEFLGILENLSDVNGVTVLATPNASNLERWVRWEHLFKYYSRLRRAGLSRISGLLAILKRDSVFCWDPPRHLHAFTRKSLMALLSDTGFTGEVKCGFCRDPLYDPRMKNVPPPGFSFGKTTLRDLRNDWGTAFLQKIFSSGGEHLFAILRSNKTPPLSS